MTDSTLWWPWDRWWNHLDFYSFSSISHSPPLCLSLSWATTGTLPCKNRSLALCWSRRLCAPSLSPRFESVAAVSSVPCCWGFQSGVVVQQGGRTSVETKAGQGAGGPTSDISEKVGYFRFSSTQRPKIVCKDQSHWMNKNEGITQKDVFPDKLNNSLYTESLTLDSKLDLVSSPREPAILMLIKRRTL